MSIRRTDYGRLASGSRARTGTACRTEEAQETSGQKRRERADSSIFIYILFILVLRKLTMPR